MAEAQSNMGEVGHDHSWALHILPEHLEPRAWQAAARSSLRPHYAARNVAEPKHYKLTVPAAASA